MSTWSETQATSCKIWIMVTDIRDPGIKLMHLIAPSVNMYKKNPNILEMQAIHFFQPHYLY